MKKIEELAAEIIDQCTCGASLSDIMYLIEDFYKWIPVKEDQLPDNMTAVLMRDNGCYPVRSTGLFKDGIFYPDFKVLEHKHVTHWRPIEYK